MTDLFDTRPRVARALAEGRSVVALESTVIAHGLPRPANLETAVEMESRVRDLGAEPATIGLLSGRVVVGLTGSELEQMASSDQVVKVSRADLGAVVAAGGLGATTVATTVWAAARAGIRVVATGGIGGVHRDLPGLEPSWDVSADLAELARSPVAVVCAGAKAVLDLPRTLEFLETAGVPVVGYGTREFAGFYSRTSGLELAHSVATPAEAARFLSAHWSLCPGSGAVLAQPAPESAAMARERVEELVERALAEANGEAVRGKAVTPYLLERLTELSDGATLRVNRALLQANATLAARVAQALAGDPAVS